MVADVACRDAKAQADALAAGTTSASALAEACLDRIARQNASLGAFWHVDAEGVRAAAAMSDRRRRSGHARGLLDGICIAVKDNIDVAGLPATSGIAVFRKRVATEDAPFVARLRQAGLVIVGKTAMHEGALGATTDTPGFGRCHNPLRHGFTPGGSSGGSAAAVAAGLVALAIGTDTMGSVRIPAAYCGVTGLKPTAGLVSRTGVMQLSSTLDSIGVLARTPQDTAMVLAIMAGLDPFDTLSRTAPQGWQALAPAPPDLAGLTVAVPSGFGGVSIEAAIMDAHEQACLMLAARGARLVTTDIACWQPTRLRRAALLLAEVEASTAHPGLIDDPSAASADYRAALAFGRGTTPERLVAAHAEMAAVTAGVMRLLGSASAIMLPTTPQVAFAHGSEVPADQADLTVLANVAGLPAIAIPWPAPKGSLPASIQLVGRPFAEADIVAMASVLLAGSQ